MALDDCPECSPRRGTIGYRLDRVPPSTSHHPLVGDHVHLFVMHQNPHNCTCFWNKYGVIGGSVPPTGAIAMPF